MAFFWARLSTVILTSGVAAACAFAGLGLPSRPSLTSVSFKTETMFETHVARYAFKNAQFYMLLDLLADRLSLEVKRQRSQLLSDPLDLWIEMQVDSDIL